MVWMSRIRRRNELLDQASDRIAVGAHAAFLSHHIALFVELPEYRVRVARRLKIGPQFQPIGGQRVEVSSVVPSGKRIHALDAIAVEDFGKLIGDYVLLGIFDRVLPGFL